MVWRPPKLRALRLQIMAEIAAPMPLQIEAFLDVDACRLSSLLTNWTLSSRQVSSALKKWSVPNHQNAAWM